MGYKVQFENGHTVEFDSKPSDSDIDEAYAHTQSLVQPKESLLEKATGVGEGALNVLTGIAAPITGPIMGGLTALNEVAAGRSAKERVPSYESLIENATYSPRTEIGQDIAQAAGEFTNRYLIPIAPMLGVTGVGKLSQPRAKAVLREAPEVKINPQEQRVAELKARKVSTPGPEGFQRPGQALDAFERQVKAEEPIYVNKEGFATQSKDLLDVAQQQRDLLNERLTEERKAQEAQNFLEAEQMPIFDPEAEMHRAYTDIRAATKEGGERAFTRKEFEKILENLAEKEDPNARKGTGFRMPPPEEMDAAYANYLQHLDENQGSFFDIGSRQEAWQKGPVPEERQFFPTEREGHPFIENIEQAKDTKEYELRKEIDAEKSVAAGAGVEVPKFSVSDFLRKNTLGEITSKEPSPYARAAQEALYQEDHPLHNHPVFGNRLSDIAHTGIESPEHAIELVSKSKDVAQNKVQKAFNYLTKGQWIKGRVNHPLVHFTVDVMNDNANYGHALVAERVHKVYDNAIRDLKGKDRTDVAELINTSDLLQKEITPEQLDSWGLSKEARHAIEVIQENMKISLDETNRALRAVGSKEIEARKGYIPMNAKGNHRKVAYKYAKDEQGNIISDEKGNPKTTVVGVISSDFLTLPKVKVKGIEVERGWSLDRLQRYMLEKDPELMFSESVNFSGNKGLHNATEGAALEVLKRLADNNKDIKQFLETLQIVAAEDPKSYMGMMKHTKAKKGVWGMEGRKPWLSAEENAEQLFQNMRDYQERSMKWGFLAEGAADVNQVMRSEQVAMDHPNAVRLSEKILQQHLGITATNVAKAFDTIISGAFLGNKALPQMMSQTARGISNKLLFGWFNPGFLMAQILQPVLETPAMAMYLKSKGASVDSFGATSMAKATLWMGKMTEPGRKISDLAPYQKEALEYAKQNAVYPEDLVEHNQQLKRNAAYYVNTTADYLPKKADTATRMFNFYTYVEMLHEAGITPEQGLFKQAHELTKKTMNDYSRANRPAIYDELGMLGDSIYNLQSYPHNQISKLSFFFDNLVKEKSIEAAAPLITQTMSTIVGAGLIGLPFMALWAAVYQQLSELLGEPRDLTLDMMNASSKVFGELGPDAQYMGSHGIFAAAGIDMSNRLAGPLASSRTPMDILTPGLSKIGGAVSSTAKAIIDPKQENIEAALYNAAPSGAQGLLDTMLFQKDNLAKSKNPENFKIMAERTPGDVTARKFGLTGIQEATSKTKEFHEDQLDRVYGDIRKQALNGMKHDLWYGRDISDNLATFVIDGQGDMNSFDKTLQQLIIDGSVSPQTARLLRDTASKSMPRIQSLARRTQ